MEGITNTSIDIVNLIENNPISKFNTTKYQSKLIEKLQSKFTNYEQQLFLSSFYCYIKYDKINDFVIDLDDIWKWLGFSQKYHAKYLLEKQFIIDKDYKCLLPKLREQTFMTNDEIIPHPKKELKKSRGGHNKEIIMMSVITFKKFCLKANTKKADEIHDYFIKLEETLQEIINDDSNELRIQLEDKDSEIDKIKYEKDSIISNKDSEIDKIKYEKMKEIESVIISNFPVNTECIYIGKIDNLSTHNETLLKFGHTNNLSIRVFDHRKNYDNFILLHAFKVLNKVEIENCIKMNSKIRKQLRTINVNDKNKTELIAYNESFTIDMLISDIKKIIHDKTYNIQNFDRLVERNQFLESENIRLNDIFENNKLEINSHLLKINELQEKIGVQNVVIESVNKDNESIYDNVLLPNDDVTMRFNDFVDNMCIIHPDYYENSINIEGRFRLWNKKKPLKDVFHALKNYFDSRFRQTRVNNIHSYYGIKLKEVEYKKITINSSVETFIFEKCKFSDTGKVLDSILLEEYQKWKKSVDLELSDNDIRDIKEYLNSNNNVLRAVVWTKQGNNNGYYGLHLRKDDNIGLSSPKCSTGKKIKKINIETNEVLGKWETIAQAASSESICSAKMSRYVKNKTIVNNTYYCIY